MNENSLGALLVRHSNRLRTAAVTLAIAALCTTALAACALPSLGKKKVSAGAPSAAHCAELVAHAFSSPNVPIHGAYACLDPVQQAGLASIRVTDDASFAIYAATEPVFDHYSYWGRGISTGDYYFNLSGPAGKACIAFHENSAGLVDGGGFYSGACPQLRTK